MIFKVSSKSVNSMMIYDSSVSYVGSTKHRTTVHHRIKHLVVYSMFADEWVISDIYFSLNCNQENKDPSDHELQLNKNAISECLFCKKKVYRMEILDPFFQSNHLDVYSY